MLEYWRVRSAFEAARALLSDKIQTLFIQFNIL